MYEFLRNVALFADLSDDDMARLCALVTRVPLRAGQVLFAEGSPSDHVYVVESGELEVLKVAGERTLLLDISTTGDVIGEAALLDNTPRQATLRARTDSSVLAIGHAEIDTLLATNPAAARVLLNTTVARWRGMGAALRQTEKMAQLGTLTAGVAHELNNPAAAMKRNAAHLHTAIMEFAAAEVAAACMGLTAAQLDWLEQKKQATRLDLERTARQWDALTRSDMEYAVEEWLDKHGVAAPWDIAPILVSSGYDVPALASLSDHFAPGQIPVIATNLAATAAMHTLLVEIGQGADRIAAIVGALKSYAYLDQAPTQRVDIHAGLENTLLLLHAKLGDIAVTRDFAPDLPSIDGYGSELNQVWTHLLDNAVDALATTERPEIVVRTRCIDGEITVAVEDNGPGIPSDIQARIFDAFFTTKPPGKGAGLGLDVSYRIVAEKHRGDIVLTSQPGRTCFTVTLPVGVPTAEIARSTHA
jgi:signal transduction histidine kinase